MEKDDLKKYLKDYFICDDITFCAEKDCPNTDCFRNEKNMNDRTIPHSFAFFRGSKYCPSYFEEVK